MAQGRLVAIAAVLILLFAGVPVAQQALWSSATDSQPQNAFNNSFTPTEGTVQTLAVSNQTDVVYAPQSDINVTQNGTEITAPGNWSWLRHNGTIEVKSGTSFNTSDTAHVEGYTVVPSTAQNTTETFMLIPTRDIGAEWIMAAVVVLMMLALGLLARTP